MTHSISSMAPSSSYDSYLDRSIVNAVREGAHDLWHLISVLPGFDPTLVREAVARLIGNSVIPEGIRDEAPQTNPEPHSQLEVPGLPVPHPLDFDWRFTRGTAGMLLERLDALSRSANPVALLGTPSVYVLAETRGWPTSSSYLTRTTHWRTGKRVLLLAEGSIVVILWTVYRASLWSTQF